MLSVNWNDTVLLLQICNSSGDIESGFQSALKFLTVQYPSFEFQSTAPLNEKLMSLAMHI